ncbi:DUF4157 domain-containing protein [uncultured Amnibacterium sp.]|uniref:eCIS core domain-containing protein n=1 Tax=uncultured Amnibacterium sp. TaxID=1631851 RepID=UPI0035CBF0BC
MAMERQHRDERESAEELGRPSRTGASTAQAAEALQLAAAGHVSPHGVLALQRAVGNAATAEVVQREEQPEEEEELQMSRLRSDSGSPEAVQREEESPVLSLLRSGSGSPLPSPVRGDMERRLGSDFGDVRVHTGADAHESATSVGASAYTVGSDVVFQNGRYDPSSDQGRHTLAHELTHVVQQRSGPVDGTPTGDGVSVSDPGDRFERAAVASADRAMQEDPGAKG